jgi:hypothetical protein
MRETVRWHGKGDRSKGRPHTDFGKGDTEYFEEKGELQGKE